MFWKKCGNAGNYQICGISRTIAGWLTPMNFTVLLDKVSFCWRMFGDINWALSLVHYVLWRSLMRPPPRKSDSWFSGVCHGQLHLCLTVPFHCLPPSLLTMKHKETYFLFHSHDCVLIGVGPALQATSNDPLSDSGGYQLDNHLSNSRWDNCWWFIQSEDWGYHWFIYCSLKTIISAKDLMCISRVCSVNYIVGVQFIN